MNYEKKLAYLKAKPYLQYKILGEGTDFEALSWVEEDTNVLGYLLFKHEPYHMGGIYHERVSAWYVSGDQMLEELDKFWGKLCFCFL